jgi:hypothetical protein
MGNCFIDSNGCINSHPGVGVSDYPSSDSCTFVTNQAVTIDQQIWDLEGVFDEIIVSRGVVQIGDFDDNNQIAGESFQAGDVFVWDSDGSNCCDTNGTYRGWRLCPA